MTKKFQVLLAFGLILFSELLSAQSCPLLGYVEMTEVCVLVHTQDIRFEKNDAVIKLEYWDQKNPAQKKTKYSDPINQNKTHTYHFKIADLLPGTSYQYRYSADNSNYPDKTYSFRTQPLWQYRTDPPAFRVAAGSCAYINETDFDRPGKPYGSDYFIFDTIVTKKPDMMLWLGDNIYLREVDYNSESGIIHRYNHTRSTPEIQNLLSFCPNYAIWDDHDFGPNDANGSYIHKDKTLKAFKEYWANPGYGISGAENGITTSFQFMDIDFFLLDNRYNRTGNDVIGAEKPTILGDVQINWLIQSLKASSSPFKIIAIGGQFLNPVAKFENYSVYTEEREKIIRLIEENNIKGVVFLTGDRHCTELSKLELKNGNVIYDVTISPLTSHAYDNTNEANTLRIDGTLVPKANFATLDFTGPKKERKLTVTVYDNKGVMLWSEELN